MRTTPSRPRCFHPLCNISPFRLGKNQLQSSTPFGEGKGDFLLLAGASEWRGGQEEAPSKLSVAFGERKVAMWRIGTATMGMIATSSARMCSGEWWRCLPTPPPPSALPRHKCASVHVQPPMPSVLPIQQMENNCQGFASPCIFQDHPCSWGTSSRRRFGSSVTMNEMTSCKRMLTHSTVSHMSTAAMPHHVDLSRTPGCWERW